MRNILALDGGGIKGRVQAGVLARLQQHCKLPLYSALDLISGTSVGGINAIAIALGIEPDELVKFYSEQGPYIFSRSRTEKLTRNQVITAKYDPVKRRRALAEYFGTMRLRDCKTRVMVSYYDAVHMDPQFFKSWQDGDALCVDAAMATSAAQTFWPSEHGLVDGGTFANDPAMPGHVEAIKLWPQEPLRVLSIGCGDGPPCEKPQPGNWGIVQWAQRLLNDTMSGPRVSDEHMIAVYAAARGDQYARWTPGMGTVSTAMDDASQEHIAALATVAEKFCDSNESQIQAMADALAIAKGATA